MKILHVNTNEWQDASNVCEGGKFKAINNFYGGDSTSLLFLAPAGSIIDNHKHPEMEFCICLEGQVQFKLNNNEITLLEPIESIYIKPEEYHEVEFIKDTQLFISWSPKISL